MVQKVCKHEKRRFCMYLNFDNCFSSSNDDDDPLMLLLVKVARNLLVKRPVFMIQHYIAVLSSLISYTWLK